MKKTFWSLAALMLMAAPVMTSCSNDLDEVAPVEEVKSNVVTITIAPPVAEPETRVTIDGISLKITGWANGDEVTLYNKPATDKMLYPVTFTCIDASTGTFSGDLGTRSIGEYNFAVFGGVPKSQNYNGSYTTLEPKVSCSTELKSVIMMTALKDSWGRYVMTIANNVLKIKNGTGSDVEVAWYGNSSGGSETYFTPMNYLYNNTWRGAIIDFLPASYLGWANVPHFTLPAGEDSYVCMPMSGARWGDQDVWGLAKEDGTIFLTPKGHTNDLAGKLYNAGTIN